jgi:hypothetical protein
MLFAATLTVDQVQDEVRRIAEMAGDFEVAHEAEDALRAVVLEAIAINRLSGVDAQRAALAAYSTRDIEFARYCA